MATHQIEGDRITSYLRHTLRKGRGGSGPGMFLPVMPVMYTKSIWLRYLQTGKGTIIYLIKRENYHTGILVHLWRFVAICLK